MKRLTLKLNPIKTIQEILRLIEEDPKNSVTVTLEVEDYKEEKLRVTPEDYCEFSKLVDSFGINLKDIREIILLARSYWEARKQDPWCTDRIVLGFHISHKSDYKEVIYSEEFLQDTLRALSVTNNPVSDFYSRITRISLNPEDTFETYYKRLYASV